MNEVDLEQLSIDYPDNEDLILVYREWGKSSCLHELFSVLDRYEPSWNKEKELGSWSARFILDILDDSDEVWENMSREERLVRFKELVDERYEDFRCSHQFSRVNNITLHLQEGEDLDAILAEGDEKVMFPKLFKKRE